LNQIDVKQIEGKNDYTAASELNENAWKEVIHFYMTMIREPQNCSGPQWDLLLKKFLLYLYSGFQTINPPTTLEQLQEYIDKHRKTDETDPPTEQPTHNQNSNPPEKDTPNAAATTGQEQSTPDNIDIRMGTSSA
jgi:hypothetical protein